MATYKNKEMFSARLQAVFASSGALVKLSVDGGTDTIYQLTNKRRKLQDFSMFVMSG